jgi:hypothetical protein
MDPRWTSSETGPCSRCGAPTAEHPAFLVSGPQWCAVFCSIDCLFGTPMRWCQRCEHRAPLHVDDELHECCRTCGYVLEREA